MLFLSSGLLLSGETTLDESSMRVRVRPDSPAAQAGLEDGDRVISVDGKPMQDWDTLRREMAAHRGAAAAVVVERAGAEVRLDATPSADGKIGIGPPATLRSIGAGAAFARGLVEPFGIISNAVKGLIRLVTGTEKTELSGPVAIVSETGKSQQAGLGSALRLLGGLSAYFLFFPVVLALVFFPRAKKR